MLDRGCVYGFVLVYVESKRSNLWFEFGWGFYRGSRLSIGVGFSFNGEVIWVIEGFSRAVTV